MLGISTKFYPIRLNAYMRNEVEMEITVRNDGSEPRWVECDIIVPESISLAPDKQLAKGRVRVGIIMPRESMGRKVKIYAGASSYPDTYAIRLTAFGFGKDGTIASREEKKAELRCERVGMP